MSRVRNILEKPDLCYTTIAHPHLGVFMLEKTSFKTVLINSSLYPPLLHQIADPPNQLYYKGHLPKQNELLLTVVGSRKISNYGHDALAYLLSPLIMAGVGIVSGLAFGIDAAAHRLALKHGQYTLAVLASGIDQITPVSHTNLGNSIIEASGGIASEFTPGTSAYPSNFRQRNRILAGLSPVTLVVEAAYKSGALITAHYALDFNRDVAAVPGSIFSQVSQGCNKLLSQGAQVIFHPEQLLQLYKLDKSSQPKIKLSRKEKFLLENLNSEIQTLDDLQKKTLLQSPELLSLLMQLELKGLVRNQQGQGYSLKYPLGSNE